MLCGGYAGSPEATWTVEAGVLDPSLTEFSMCVQQRRAVGVLNGTLPSYVVVQMGEHADRYSRADESIFKLR